MRRLLQLLALTVFALVPSVLRAAQPVQIVDLLVVGTTEAVSAAGGEDRLNERARAAVASANLILENSRVDLRLRLVGFRVSSGQESSWLETELDRMRDPADGRRDEIPGWRDELGADLVCLVVDNAPDISFKGLPGPSAANAYSAVAQSALLDSNALALAVSFNFGCQLERSDATPGGAFSFSLGHTFAVPGQGMFSTIDGAQSRRVPWFSNPDLSHLGVPTGIAAGSPNAADNARTLRLTAPIVAQFRGAAPMTLPPTVAFVPPPNATVRTVAQESPVLLEVSASDADGTVARVDYFLERDNGLVREWLGASTNAPFAFFWKPRDTGRCAVLAVATDNHGASGRSTTSLEFDVVPAAPANDLFANAQRLVGSLVDVEGRTTFATRETSEPGPGGGSVWYRWTAPNYGRLIVRRGAYRQGQYFGVFRGDAVGSLVKVRDNDAGSPTSFQSTIYVPVEAGVDYVLAVMNPVQPMASFGLELRLESSLHVELAQPLDGAIFPGGAPVSLQAAISLVDGSPITQAEVWRNNQTWVALAPPFTKTVLSNLPSGQQTLKLRVVDADGRNAESAPVTIRVGPANDAFTAPEPLDGTNFVFSGTVALASIEPGEPAPAGAIQSRSVWYRWTAPSNGRVRIHAESRQTPLVAVAYTGTELTNLTQIAWKWLANILEFTAVAGETYRLLVAIPAPESEVFNGGFSLGFQFRARESNDPFSTPKKLTGVPATETGEDAIATLDPGEVPPAEGLPGHSLWWSWTAPTSGLYRLGAQPEVATNTVFLAFYDADTFTLDLPPARTSHDGSLLFDAIAGREYRFMTDRSSGLPGRFQLLLTLVPAQDQFSNLAVLTGTNVAVEADSRFSTLEPGDTALFGVNARRSQWWSWTAPVNGWVRVVAEEVQFPFVLRAFTGTSRDSLTVFGGITNTSFGRPPYPSDFWFPLMAGQTAILGRAGLWDIPDGETDLAQFRVEFSPAPTNDAFADAAELATSLRLTVVSNSIATLETGEPDPGEFGQTGPIGTLWWRWTAPQAGTFLVRAAYWTLVGRLNVYQGETLTSLVPVGTRRNSGLGPSEMVLEATQGSSFWIAVARSDDYYGIALSVALLERPLNDDFANRLPLVGTNVVVTGSTVEATLETGEPGQSLSAWWTWTAPANGMLEVALTNADGFCGVDVFTGASLATLNLKGKADDYGFGMVFAHIPVNAGEAYAIRVRPSEFSANRGTTFDLGLFFHPAPVGDDFTQPLELTGREIIQTNSFLGASDEAWESPLTGRANGQSLWFRWTAPESGSYCVTASSSNYYSPKVAVQVGDSPENLSWPYRSVVMGEGGAAFWAEAGRTYCFLVHAGFGWGSANPPAMLFPPFEFALYPSRIVIPSPAQGETVAYGSTVALTPVVTGAESDPANFEISIYPENWEAPIPYPGSRTWLVNLYGTNGFMVRATIDGRLHQTAPTWVIARPANDRFVDAALLVTNQFVSGLLSEATAEPQEPIGQTNSLWWRWTAPATGRYWINPQFPGSSPSFAVYRGDTLDGADLLTAGTGSLPFDATVGTEYRIAQFGRTDVGLEFFIGSKPWPENDAFANRLPVLNNQIVASSAYATRETGEPIHGGESPGRSLWWTWTAEADGQLQIEFSTDLGFPALLAVYRGDSLSALTEEVVLKAQPSTFDLPNTVTNAFPVTAGVAYALALDGSQYGFLEARAKLTFRPYLANDAFAQATVLSGSSFDFTGTNALTLGATTVEPGEPDHGTASPTHSRWWAWNLPSAGHVSLALTGAPPGIMLAAYRGEALASLTLIGHTNQGRLEFDVESAETVRVAVAGHNPDARFGLSFQFYPVPANDAFASATELPAAGFDGTVWNYGATLEPGEPVLNSLGGQPGGASLWWSWTPQNRGAASLFTEFLGGWNPSILGVYRGSALESLEPVPTALNNQGGIDLLVSAGERYWIKTDWGLGAEGRFRLRLSYTPAHTNDAFASPADLADGSYVYWRFNSATLEPGEQRASDDSIGASLWYRWTAPANGPTRVVSSNPRSRVVVFTGSTLDGLTAVPTATSGPPYTTNVFHATVGTTYRIRVTATTDRTTGFTLDLTGPPRPPRLQLSRAPGNAPGIGFALNGVTDRTIALQASTNLLDWITIGYETPADDSPVWIDPDAAEIPHRFYRALPWEDLLGVE